MGSRAGRWRLFVPFKAHFQFECHVHEASSGVILGPDAGERRAGGTSPVWTIVS